MRSPHALRLALELARMPTLLAGMRAQPLPADTLVLIRIAAGCTVTCRGAVEATGRPLEDIRAAAVQYLQQVLFSPDSDGFRVLGVQPTASKKVMREHLRWLLLWLHPDKNQNEWENVFAARVLAAWRQVGAGRPRAEGSEQPDVSSSRRTLARFRPPGQRWIVLPLEKAGGGHAKWRRLTNGFIAAMLAAAVLVVPDIRTGPVRISSATAMIAETAQTIVGPLVCLVRGGHC